jgi:hypothetical protein
LKTWGNPGSVPLRDHVLALFAEKDLRDQQRYDAQTKALDAALLAQQTAVGAALTAAEKAVTKAEVAAEKRFDSVNEFRQAYQDIIREQMPRAEAEQRLSAMAEKIEDLKLSRSAGLGRVAGASALWGYVVGAVGVAAAVVAIVVNLH